MSDAPTLFDALAKITFTQAYRKYLDPQGVFRNALFNANRFVLDKSMSALMADLAYAAFADNAQGAL